MRNIENPHEHGNENNPEVTESEINEYLEERRQQQHDRGIEFIAEIEYRRRYPHEDQSLAATEAKVKANTKRFEQVVEEIPEGDRAIIKSIVAQGIANVMTRYTTLVEKAFLSRSLGEEAQAVLDKYLRQIAIEEIKLRKKRNRGSE